MTSDHWQLQEAKQRFSALVRAVHEEGPQFVTRHGEEVVVVVDVADYRRFAGERPDFKVFLTSAPHLDDLEIERDSAQAPRADLGST